MVIRNNKENKDTTRGNSVDLGYIYIYQDINRRKLNYIIEVVQLRQKLSIYKSRRL